MGYNYLQSFLLHLTLALKSDEKLLVSPICLKILDTLWWSEMVSACFTKPDKNQGLHNKNQYLR